LLIQSTAPADLPDGFIRALNLLKDSGVQPRASTKPVSRYAVIVVDDREVLSAATLLRASDMVVAIDPP
jgi:hypothetical protein